METVASNIEATCYLGYHSLSYASILTGQEKVRINHGKSLEKSREILQLVKIYSYFLKSQDNFKMFVCDSSICIITRTYSLLFFML